MSSTTHQYRLKILEHHLDTFGHVNNAVYLEILEEARWDLITSKGYGMDYVQKTKLGPVILDVTLRFKKELRLREEIVVATWCASYQKRIGKLEQTISNTAGQICLEAVFTFGLFDLTARHLVLPTDEWLKAVGMLPPI